MLHNAPEPFSVKSKSGDRHLLYRCINCIVPLSSRTPILRFLTYFLNIYHYLIVVCVEKCMCNELLVTIIILGPCETVYVSAYFEKDTK